jgi:hypothetical protein
MPNAGPLGRVRHGLGIRIIQGERLLAHYMFAGGDGRQGDGGMGEVRSRDEDGMDIVAADNLLVTRGGDFQARLLTSPFERSRIVVAQGDHPRFRTHRETRQMILQRDSTATNDCYTDRFHDDSALDQRAGVWRGW